MHKVLYIVNIGLNDDFETQKPAFSKALEEYGIFNLLKQVIACVDHFGCGILKMVGPKKQNFWQKINILKGNHCILRIRGAPVRQKIEHDFRK